MRVGALPPYAVTAAGTISLYAPRAPGSHDLLVSLRSGDAVVSENRYPIHVVARACAPYDVALVGDDLARTASALERVGARRCLDGAVLVVGEGGLDVTAGLRATEHVSSGGTVLVLAQDAAAGEHYPVPVRLAGLQTGRPSPDVHVTTDSGALPSLPRRNVLVAETSTVQVRSLVVQVGNRSFPDEPVVLAHPAGPEALTGTVVGGHRVAPGRLLLCQYRLVNRASAGDAAATALLADLLNGAADPRTATFAERTVKDDGRALTYYSSGNSSGGAS